MRQDMSKVIVERPRLGGGARLPKGDRRRSQSSCIDDVPLQEGMRRRWSRSGSYKSLNENLAPLRRFLQRRVGRPWDNVFSEICEHLRITSAVQKHVRDHLHDLVAIHVKLDGRIIRPKAGRSSWGADEIYQPFYVHPRTGYLRANPRKSKTLYRDRPRDYIVIDDLRQIRRVNEIWYAVKLAPLPKNGPSVWDAILRISLQYTSETARNLTNLYGSVVYASSKRQLNSREIRNYRDEIGQINSEIE